MWNTKGLSDKPASHHSGASPTQPASPRYRRALASSLGPFKRERFPYRKFITALALGGAGGSLFAHFSLPLAWMLGPMTFCTIGALLKAPIAAPSIVRPPMIIVIGVLLGSGFRPDLIGHLADWIPTLLGLVLFVAVSAVLCITYFRVVAGFDWVTAYFSGMPGGLVVMTVLGEERGGDGGMIALVHAARILLVVMTLPFLVEWLSGETITSGTGTAGAGTPFIEGAFWFLVSAVLGVIIGRLLRFPSPEMIGPMTVSAAIHLSGVTHFVPPYGLVIAAQLVLGTVIGCRFRSTPPATVLKVMLLSLGSTVILLTVTYGFAYTIGHFTRFDALALMLAYSPGGLTEMSLVALSLQVEVAFVATHHIARILIVLITSNTAFGLISRFRKRKI